MTNTTNPTEPAVTHLPLIPPAFAFAANALVVAVACETQQPSTTPNEATYAGVCIYTDPTTGERVFLNRSVLTRHAGGRALIGRSTATGRLTVVRDWRGVIGVTTSERVWAKMVRNLNGPSKATLAQMGSAHEGTKLDMTRTNATYTEVRAVALPA